MARATAQPENNSLLQQFDDAIHAVTEKHRKAHPTHWFSVASTHVQERSKPVPAQSAPKNQTPLTAAYLNDLNAVVERFNNANGDWTFFYKGARVESLMKAGSIKHDTRPLTGSEMTGQ